MSIVLDTAIALALVFLLVSLLASALQEALANWLNSRGKLLESAITQLLNGHLYEAPGRMGWATDAFRREARVGAAGSALRDTLAGQVLSHGLLDGLLRGTRLPTYIPAEKFADALIDSLRRRAGETTPSQLGLLNAVRKLPPSKASAALETLLISAGPDLANVRRQIVDWYEATMQRVTGWYARDARWRTFLLGLAIAISFQIDAVRITQQVMTDASLRADLVTAAELQSKAGMPATPQVTEGIKQLGQLNLPIGWSSCAISDRKIVDAAGKLTGQCDTSQWTWRLLGTMFLGWLVVALAVTQGAPFWFDLINQLISLRGTGAKPGAQGAQPSGGTGAGTLGTTASPWTAASPDENTLPAGMTRDDLRNVQAALGVPITAVIDVNTRDAVRSFQKRINIGITGTLDAALAKEILRAQR
jgi:hypothetical protein